MTHIRLTDVIRNKVMIASEKSLWDNNKESKEAIRYLVETRKLDNEIIKKFRFGYVPLDARYKIPDLGHIFAGKVIMPIFDAYDNLIALTSRDFRTNNSFEKHWHESFDKPWELFGINIAKKSIVRNNKVIIVEGQFDTCKMHKFGFDMTVGILGSAFSMKHLCILSSRCANIYLLFDNDKSGSDNIKRSMKMYKDKALKYFNIKFIPIHLKEFKDPDEYLDRYGKEGMMKVLENIISKKKEIDIYA